MGPDLVSVTAIQCVHCGGLFIDRDLALAHIDKCAVRNADKSKYPENSDTGNMILKEAV